MECQDTNMSMHLVGPYMTTTRYGKPKFKMTKTMREQWQLDWMEKNRRLKRGGDAKISFEQYCDERRGIVPKVAAKRQAAVVKDYLKIPDDRNPYKIKSLNSEAGYASKKPIQQYTGDAMIGISVLHKSNGIPVFRNEDVKDISKMRRG